MDRAEFTVYCWRAADLCANDEISSQQPRRRPLTCGPRWQRTLSIASEIPLRQRLQFWTDQKSLAQLFIHRYAFGRVLRRERTTADKESRVMLDRVFRNAAPKKMEHD